MPNLSIDLMGPMQVSIDDQRITTLESDKVRALLAYLVVEADHPHTRASLVGLLWPEYPEESARHNLRQALFNLRLMLGDRSAEPPYLLITRDTIQFNTMSNYSIDTDRFNRIFSAYQARLPVDIEDRSALASDLEEAVQLYRGEFLAQLTLDECSEFEEWLLVKRERFHQKILEALSYLASYYESKADFNTARRHAARQLELDPWREEAHCQMMRALALDGQRSAALAQYEACKRILASELGVQPSDETHDLYEQIRLGNLRPNVEQSTSASFGPLTSLPAQLTPFVGREADIGQLGKMISDPSCRCITLVGPGGIGKTRLTIQAAANNLDGFKHGVAFIPLAAVDTFVGVIPAITNAINLPIYGPGDPHDVLLSYLHEKQMLLVLDNVEQLLVTGISKNCFIELLIDILQRAPGVTLLITSREAINLQEEWIYEVRGLPFPEASATEGFEGYDAIALFYQRARRVHPSFVLDTENSSDVARICRLVDGMPLAIELAAMWIRTLTPFEIAEEIAKGLDFLSSSYGDIPERHRSIRVVFDHSWDFISADEQQALARLSVFRGGFQRQAAEKVAGATLSILSMLVNRTLLQRTGAGRYELHELVRQYCAVRLSATPQEKFVTQERHYSFYLELAEAAEEELKGSRQLEWLGTLEQDHDNFRAALEWALENDAKVPGGNARSLRLSASLRWFWRMRGHFHEGLEWLMESLRQCQECTLGARGNALLGVSLLTNALGDLGAARAPAEESVSIFRNSGDQAHLAEALMIAGLTALWEGEAASGYEWGREALAIYRQLGDRGGEAQALYRLGSYLSDYSGDPAGKTMLEESASILESLGEKYLYTSVLISLGIVDLSHGDYAAAKSRFERGLVSTKEIRHPWGIADALTNIGCLLRIQGEYEKAEACFTEALEVYKEHGRNVWEVDAWCAMAENAICQGDLPAAKDNLSTATIILGKSENKWLQVLLLYFKGKLAYYEKEYEDAAGLLAKAATFAREGRFKPDLARSLVALSLANAKLGEAGRAFEPLREGLEIYWSTSNKLGIVTALEARAELDILEANYSSAAEAFGAAQHLRQAIGAVRAPIDRAEYEPDIALIRDQLGEDEFRELSSQPGAEFVNGIVGEILSGETPG